VKITYQLFRLQRQL